ncbi:hypothetical protein [Nesterenkonia natronophila]|uniref:Phage head morphogenesis domain-containing protein n=1 Tax=Nesterenkonia natronophila TaxID=2174932 RepID=A0A3A4F4U6_9MICC|nr:hypothetical protein [Nesterenkonia natronophila]RJN32908.1 hypothetical protein D3250_03595 [Nesterenkonia natronophila]
MSIHDTVARLSDTARTRLEALARRMDAEELTWDEFHALATTEAARRSSAASSLAVLAVAAELSRLTGRPRATSTPRPEFDLEEHAYDAITEQTGTQSFGLDPVAAMGIAGAAIVMAAYQSTTNRAMRDQGVSFYRRQVEHDACEICLDMADIVLPTTHQQWHHKGCRCVAVPVSENGADQ